MHPEIPFMRRRIEFDLERAPRAKPPAREGAGLSPDLIPALALAAGPVVVMVAIFLLS